MLRTNPGLKHRGNSYVVKADILFAHFPWLKRWGNSYVAKADILFASLPRAKATGQFIFG
jgi:hypothetical protein